MGTRGPKGDKLVTDALRVAMLREAKTPGQDGKSRNRVYAMAEQIAERAEEGDDWAVQFVTDRLEGKASQHFEGEINHIHEQVTHDADAFQSRITAQLATRGSSEGTGKPH